MNRKDETIHSSRCKAFYVFVCLVVHCVWYSAVRDVCTSKEKSRLFISTVQVTWLPSPQRKEEKPTRDNPFLVQYFTLTLQLSFCPSRSFFSFSWHSKIGASKMKRCPTFNIGLVQYSTRLHTFIRLSICRLFSFVSSKQLSIHSFMNYPKDGYVMKNKQKIGKWYLKYQTQKRN